MSELKPYAEMKDSGVTWLGDVPAHWKVRRGKTIFRRIDERSATGREELLTVSSDRGVVPRKTVSVSMFKAESYVGYKLCSPGDLVINSLWAWGRGLGISRYRGIISTAYGVYRVRHSAAALPEFIHSLVRSAAFNWELRIRSKGIWISRLQLTDESFLAAALPLPPLPEQTAIARFLDHANSRIERQIRAKEKLIALLQEQKQVIVHEAVTGRVDVRTGKPYPVYKPSGVEWLGDVPVHWRGVALRRYCRVFAGATPSRDNPEYWNGGTIPWLASGDVNLRRILGAEQFITEAGHAASSTKWIRPGSLVLALAGQGRTKGLVATVECRTTCNQSLAAIEPSPLISDHNFLAYYLESRYLDIRSLVGDGLRDGLNLEHVRAIPTPLPPLSEQTAIARFLDDASANTTGAIARASREVNLLHEYRTRLIADAVTGKLDVREEASAHT